MANIVINKYLNLRLFAYGRYLKVELLGINTSSLRLYIANCIPQFIC